MSRYYAMSPAQELCSACDGHGTVDLGDRVSVCRPCDGLGRTWIEGGPSFGCKMTLGDRKIGEVVTLGNGDRGRVARHCKRGSPTTEVALIDDLFELESEETTTYPSVMGVRSTLPMSARSEDTAGQSRSRQDQLDPLQRETRPM